MTKGMVFRAFSFSLFLREREAPFYVSSWLSRRNCSELRGAALRQAQDRPFDCASFRLRLHFASLRTNGCVPVGSTILNSYRAAATNSPRAEMTAPVS